MSRRPKDMVVVYKDKLYCLLAFSGIHPMIPFIEGMHMAMFPEKDKVYLRLDEVIQWHEKELEKSPGKRGNAKILKLMKQTRERFVEEEAAIEKQP